MKLKTLRVKRRKTGSLDIQLQLSTNPTELQENSKLLKYGGPAPILDTVFAEANRCVSRIRTNLNVGNPVLEGVPEKVMFRDCVKPHISDAHVEEVLSRVLRPAKPSSVLTRKILRAVKHHFERRKGGGTCEASDFTISTEADAER